MDERVVYPGEADRDAAQAAALARYAAAQGAVQPPPPLPLPPEQPKPPTPPDPSEQLEPERSATGGSANKGDNLIVIAVLAVAVLGGGWWWRDKQESERYRLETEARWAREAEEARIASEKTSTEFQKLVDELRKSISPSSTPGDTGNAVPSSTDPAVITPSKTGPPSPRPDAGALLHGRYQLLANGSEVKDVQTVLVWARCSVGQRWDGRTCAGEASGFSFDEAQKLSVHGWRVPTVRELSSLVYCTSARTINEFDPEDGGAPIRNYCDGQYSAPTIRQDVFPNTPHYLYWTSLPDVDNSGSGWVTSFYKGAVLVGLSRFDRTPHVRLVHASQ